MLIKINILFLFLLIISCATNKKETHPISPSLATNKEKAYHTGTLFIKGLDLSEDMSRLSTKNDEVFVLIYNYLDTNKLNAPTVSVKKVFDKTKSSHTIPYTRSHTSLLFLIEEDSFRNIEQIEPVIRVYFKEIMKADSYNELKKYLGEDDLLGYKILTKNTNSFSISGMSTLDKFEYSIKLERE